MRGRFDAAYLLYDALLYLAGLFLIPVTLLRALVWPRSRRGILERLGLARADPRFADGLLMHGVSVGEVSAMRPLVAALRRAHPSLPLAISSTTLSGRHTAQRLFPDLAVYAFPVDLPFACHSFLRRVRPRAVVLMELEIWPNFLRACSRLELPVAIVNGRITERSMSGYRRVQRLLPQFDRIALYGVQNERYANRFRQLAVPRMRIQVTGNLKFDNLPAFDPEQGAPQPWSCWVGDRVAMVLGSTHEPEELDLLFEASRRPEFDAVLFLVVPRHPKRAPRLLRDLRGAVTGRPVLLRSQQPDSEPLPAGAILVVDSFGELEAAYRCCRLAFVGGSLIPHGGQNVLEPAALGKPVLVGPYTDNFIDEVELLEAGGGLRRAADPAGLLTCAAEWVADPASAADSGRAGASALSARRGAASTTLRMLEEAGILAPHRP